ncbi:unnamed protein product [Alternaria alternata]
MSVPQPEPVQGVGSPLPAHTVDPIDEKYQSQHTEYEEKVQPKKLVRKLDIWIMPMLWLMYWLNYLDRNAITLARLNGFQKDLGLTSSQYSTAISILFVGYILGQIPSNMIITRVKPSWYMGICMMGWAVVSGLTAVVHNYTGIVLVRFFLGVVEAPYYPGALYLLSIFYTRKEIATRISILYSGNILASSFAGLIALGVFKLDNVHGIRYGPFQPALSSPDEPLTTWWLNPEERQLAHARVARDTVGHSADVSMLAGLKEAVRDPKVWVFVYMQHLHIATKGFKNFMPTIVNTLGFSQEVTLVLTCPPYLIAGAFSVAWAISSGHYNERTWHITIAKGVAIFGFVLGCATMNVGARYFAMCVFTIGTYGVNSIILGWVSSTCGQTREKKSAALAIANVAATLSLIWTPYIWPESSEPRFVFPLSMSAGMALMCAAGAWLMRWWLIRENRRIKSSNSETTMFYAY